MQIVLIQAEIEKAIRNYVNSIVKVAEGVDIVIDLKSTRGDTGFTANIDLVEADVERATAPAPTLAPAPKAAAQKASAENSDELAAKAKAAEAEAKKKAEAEAAEQAALKQEQERAATASTEATEAEGSTEPPFEPDTKEEAPAITATEPEASEEPAAPRKPLFGRSTAALNA